MSPRSKSFNKEIVYQEYRTVRGNILVTLHPSTSLNPTSSGYQLLTYSTCLKTIAKRCYISTVSVIEEEWYREVASATGAPLLSENDRTIYIDMMSKLSIQNAKPLNNFVYIVCFFDFRSRPVVGNLRPASYIYVALRPSDLYIIEQNFTACGVHTNVHCQIRNEIYSIFSGLHWAYTQAHVKANGDQFD